MINYYETLGVQPSASQDEIKAAYRQLAKRLHPDVQGGDPVKFARTSEAYEVLSEPGRRKAFDDAMRAHRMRSEERARPQRPRRDARWQAPEPGAPFDVPGGDASGTGTPGAEGPARGAGARPGTRPTGPIPDDPGPPFTRLMSVTLPPGGRFLLEGLNGEFTILPTSADDLWETTRQKFKGEDPAELARRVVQVRLYGPRELVKQLKLAPASFGVQLQGVEKDLFGGGMDDASSFLSPRAFRLEQFFGQPVQVTATIPAGAALYLYDLSGKITVGDLRSELVANLDERTFLRAGAVASANINMNGQSRAHVTRLEGEMDAILFGQSKMLVEGHATRLRAVLEHEAHLELKGGVDWLQATVAGRGYLNGKGTVDRAHCEARAAGYIRLAKVTTAVQATRTGSAAIDVIEGPPPQSFAGSVGKVQPPPGFPGHPDFRFSGMSGGNRGGGLAPGMDSGLRPPPKEFPGFQRPGETKSRTAGAGLPPLGQPSGAPRGKRLNFGMGPLDGDELGLPPLGKTPGKSKPRGGGLF